MFFSQVQHLTSTHDTSISIHFSLPLRTSFLSMSSLVFFLSDSLTPHIFPIMAISASSYNTYSKFCVNYASILYQLQNMLKAEGDNILLTMLTFKMHECHTSTSFESKIISTTGKPESLRYCKWFLWNLRSIYNIYSIARPFPNWLWKSPNVSCIVKVLWFCSWIWTKKHAIIRLLKELNSICTCTYCNKEYVY